MPPPPGGTPRRSSRRSEPREWSALDTPVGFERCIRETLRELYGYVALLAGRDRREAERHVVDVYRSLYRAAHAGHVDSVTLGALRSAARRTWLDAHVDELTTVAEVSRAPASTIADLSALERAVLVFRHVNGMSADRAASELGRTDREIAAVGAHAVRRLRGTDDTSGAWLRAYLGPTVSPAAGLVDRIIDQLGDVAEPEPAIGTEPVDGVDEPVIDTGLSHVGPTTTEPSNVEPSNVGPSTTEPSTTEPSTTELPIVERPTLELTVVGGPADPRSAEPVVVVGEPDAAAEAIEPAAPTRPRWVFAVGVVLVVALLVALVWLALRGDRGDTIVSTPAAGSSVAPGPGSSTTVDDGPPATATSSVPSTSVAVGAVVGAVDVGFDPPCVDSVGDEPEPVTWPDTFGPLGEEPTLTVVLPESVDVGAEPERAAPQAEAILRADGLVLAVRPAVSHDAATTLLARVGLDGTVAWVRCVDGPVEVDAAPDAGVDLAVRPVGDGTGDGAWTSRSIVDGTPGGPLDPVQTAVLDGDDDERADGGGGDVALGYSYDRESGRSVLAGLDDGRVVWRATDLVLPDADAFRAEVVGDVVVARHCPGADAAGVSGCQGAELRGYDLADGALRWTEPGVQRVAATGDGHALVGDDTGWELLDVTDGTTVDGQTWPDPETFATPEDAGVTVVRVGGALVVVRPGTVEVWLAADLAGEPVAVDLS